MRNLLLLLFTYFLSLCNAMEAGDVTGFWKIPNEKTGKIEGIVGVYQYEGKIYGRIIAAVEKNGTIIDTLYTPKNRAAGVEGNPYCAGLDIIWNLRAIGNKYTDGKILDPQKGKLYSAEMWTDGNKLVVRGKIWVFGENRVWYPTVDEDFPPNFVKPDLTTMIPSIPKVRR